MFDDNSFYVPTFQQQEESEAIVPLAVFVSKRMLALTKSFRTATEDGERLELLQATIVAGASLQALTLAYLTEDPSLTESAKELFRALPK